MQRAPEHPWVQTASGRAFDLSWPTPDMVDLEVDVAEALARIPRFNGHVRAGPYSVAQHSVMGAEALLRETGRRDLAAAFLLHDAHEAYMGDITTPVAAAFKVYAAHGATLNKALLDEITPQDAQMAARYSITFAFRALKHNLDRAIHKAAGAAFPLPDDIRAAIKEMDVRMLATERRHLLGPSPAPWGGEVETARPIRLIGRFRVWPWPEAADEFRIRLRHFFPNKFTNQRGAFPAPFPRA